MDLLRLYKRTSVPLSALILSSLFLQTAGALMIQLLLFYPFNTAEAAVVTIESAPSTSGPSHTAAGSQTVFIDDQTGYKFFRASNGSCRYRKTEDGGDNWGPQEIVDSQTDCIGVVVWYDQWTPGDTGTYIHIATMDTSVDELYYNRLDTIDDSLLLTTATSVTPVSTATYTDANNRVNITKATDGKIVITADASEVGGTRIVSCTTSCGIQGNWSDLGTPPQGNADSWSMVYPLASGNLMLINRSTGNLLRYSTWNGTEWSSMINIDSAAVRGTTYDVNMAATLDIDSGSLYLVYVADANNFTLADHDIRTAVYSGGSWSNTTNILTDATTTPGIHQVAISRDQNTGDLYVAYTARTTLGDATTANTYWTRSTDEMATWETVIGPVNSSSGDFYGVDMNIMSYERVYVSWYNNTIATTRAIYGDTVADIGPAVSLSAPGEQVAVVRAETDDFYIGGTFALSSIATQTVSNIVVTETGSIDAENDLANIRLFYEFDTTDPRDCSEATYEGSETQFGSTIADGFSGANGVAAFTGTPQTIGPGQTICFFVVMDVLPSAEDGALITLVVEDPPNDVVVSGDDLPFPNQVVSLGSSTLVVDPNLTQHGFHFRLDDGSEADASSASAGNENVSISALQKEVPRRVRLSIANEGSTSTLTTSLRLEYAVSAPTCSEIVNWTVIGNGTAEWNLYDSLNLTDGADTTNIDEADGGVSDPVSSSFLSSNGVVKDTSATTGPLVLDIGTFVEVEYAIVASSSSVEGETYCFRIVRDDGIPLGTYSQYPQITIASDVLVRATGTKPTTIDVGTSNAYLGGVFSFRENTGSRDVTGITLTEQGSVNAQTGLSNISLFYEFDTVAPLDCADQSYGGTENQYGSTASSFSAENGTANFSDSVTISTTSTLCVYVVADITTVAVNGQTIDVGISSPTSDIVVSGGGSVGPSASRFISGTTTISGAILTQTHYHWRLDNGSETTAESATAGLEDIPLLDFAQGENIRLRVGISNEGATTSQPTSFRLEFGPRITTCSAVSVWTGVGVAADDWDMYDSSFLTEGEDTTNIGTSTGGLSDENAVFKTPNAGVREVSASVSTTTLANNEHVDLEFSITATAQTAFNTSYCFRITAGGVPLQTYDNYAELTTAPKRDFKIQRGVSIIPAASSSLTITAGTEYTAPASSSLAFIRITGTHHTASGRTTGAGALNADDVTAYISNPHNLDTSITFTRFGTVGDTYITWEIIEFVGDLGTDNQLQVRHVGTVNFANTALVATGTTLSNIENNNQVVVFVTGVENRDTSRDYFAGQITSEWNATSAVPVFRRGATGASVANVSYAVVEFVGLNWTIQRVEHTYTAAGVVETESITPVNSLSRSFLHIQKRMGGGSTQVVHFGHEVWLSSIGAVSFQLESGASLAFEHISVAWVIENTQTTLNGMNVQRFNGNTSGGTAPLTLNITIPSALDSVSNASIFGTSRAAGANTNFPRPLAGLEIHSTTSFNLWRGDTGSALTYRVEVVEWPVADLAVRQNYFAFFTHNNALTPDDPWPEGPAGIAENVSIGSSNNPPGEGEKIRLRMTLRISNAGMPAGLRSYKLQYGLRTTPSCTTVSSWNDVGTAASSTIWRGFTATGTTDGTALSDNPPTGGLLISLSARGGILTHQNPSAANPYAVLEGEDVEYDWHLEQNGANPRSVYCFRMVQSDGTLLDGYLRHPQIRTAGFTPITQAWRWYADTENETPTTPLAAEDVTPIEIANGDTLTMRIAIKEAKSVTGTDIRFRLQFSEDPSFVSAFEVTASSSCTASSLWCYVDGAVPDNSLITTALLSGTDPCVASVGDGCGRHVSSLENITGHTHIAGATQEYSFSIQQAGARVRAVYYFRLYDTAAGESISVDEGETYPSVIVEGPELIFSVTGLEAGTTTAGVVTTTAADSESISFGPLSVNTDYIAAHRITVSTNATEGYQVFQYVIQQLLNSYGTPISPLLSTNEVPAGWSATCALNEVGCVGYHTTDATLRGGSTRFAPIDSYAGLSLTPQEILYGGTPTIDTHDIVYRVRVSEEQPAGDYETEIVYLAVPVF